MATLTPFEKRLIASVVKSHSLTPLFLMYEDSHAPEILIKYVQDTYNIDLEERYNSFNGCQIYVDGYTDEENETTQHLDNLDLSEHREPTAYTIQCKLNHTTTNKSKTYLDISDVDALPQGSWLYDPTMSFEDQVYRPSINKTWLNDIELCRLESLKVEQNKNAECREDCENQNACTDEDQNEDEYMQVEFEDDEAIDLGAINIDNHKEIQIEEEEGEVDDVDDSFDRAKDLKDQIVRKNARKEKNIKYERPSCLDEVRKKLKQRKDKAGKEDKIRKQPSINIVVSRKLQKRFADFGTVDDDGKLYYDSSRYEFIKLLFRYGIKYRILEKDGADKINIHENKSIDQKAIESVEYVGKHPPTDGPPG